MKFEPLALLLQTVSMATAAHYQDWQPGSCDLSGAESYLEHFGIGPGLPKLDVRYGHFITKEYVVHGSDTTFAKGKDELYEPPKVTWKQTGKYTESKYVILMVDADSNLENGSSAWKPHIHWLKVNAQKTSTTGHDIFPYRPPVPKSGKHRYIVVLFEQLKPGVLSPYMKGREQWDLEGFSESNKEAMRPVSYNFFTVDADLRAEDEILALGFGDDEDDFPTQ